MMLKALIVEQLDADGTLRTFLMQPSIQGGNIVVAFADEYDDDSRSGPFHFLDEEDAKRFEEGFARCRIRKIGKSHFSFNGRTYHLDVNWSGIPTERNWLSYYALSLPEFAIPVNLSVTDPHRPEHEYKRAIRRDDSRHRYIVYLECSSSLRPFDFVISCDFSVNEKKFPVSEYGDQMTQQDGPKGNDWRYWLAQSEQAKVQTFFEDVSQTEVATSAIQRQGATPMIPEPPENYVDFHLHIDRQGRFIAHSNEGEASTYSTLVIPSNIALALDLVTENKKNATLYKNLGRQLYDLIFPGAIHTHLQKTEAVARDRRQKIRIRLDVEVEMLARLPLEFLYREDRGHFLAIDPHTALSRYLHLSYPRNSVRRRTGPLHMLVIISSPSDQVSLDVNQWSRIIAQALTEPVKQQRLELEFVTNATHEEISRALLQHKPDIIQFVGHGIYEDETGYLALMNEDGTTWLVDDDSFANLFLGSLDNLGLVCLASCESATSDNPQGFLGLTPQLIRRGVPAVIAMQYSVKVSTAELFLRHLYQNIAQRKPIDWAIQQARNAVSVRKGSNNREFATPVLYMRAEDGNIF
jgi:CHAT domain-containing protein